MTRRDVLDGKITAVVLRTVVRLLLRRLVGLVGLGQGADARDVEIAVLRVLRITGVDGLFEIYPNLQAALTNPGLAEAREAPGDG